MQVEYLQATNARVNSDLKQVTDQYERSVRVEKALNLKLDDLQ